MTGGLAISRVTAVVSHLGSCERPVIGLTDSIHSFSTQHQVSFQSCNSDHSPYNPPRPWDKTQTSSLLTRPFPVSHPQTSPTSAPAWLSCLRDLVPAAHPNLPHAAPDLCVVDALSLSSLAMPLCREASPGHPTSPLSPCLTVYTALTVTF